MLTIENFDVRSDTAGRIATLHIVEEPTLSRWRTQMIPANFPVWHRLSRGTVTRFDTQRPDPQDLLPWVLENAAPWEEAAARLAAGAVLDSERLPVDWVPVASARKRVKWYYVEHPEKLYRNALSARYYFYEDDDDYYGDGEKRVVMEIVYDEGGQHEDHGFAGGHTAAYFPAQQCGCGDWLSKRTIHEKWEDVRRRA